VLINEQYIVDCTTTALAPFNFVAQKVPRKLPVMLKGQCHEMVVEW
jgi:hypothetical protein